MSWAQHPVMAGFLAARTAQKAAREEYERLCASRRLLLLRVLTVSAHTGASALKGRSGELAVSLPAEILDRILLETVDPPARFSAESAFVSSVHGTERHARLRAVADVRRTLPPLARVCKAWQAAAKKRIAEDISPAAVWSNRQAWKAVRHIETLTFGRMRRQRTLELNFPSPIWSGDPPACLCDASVDERMPMLGYDWTRGLVTSAAAEAGYYPSRSAWKIYESGGGPECCDLLNHEPACRHNAVRFGLHPSDRAIESVVRACQYATHVAVTNMLPEQLSPRRLPAVMFAPLTFVTHFHCETWDKVTGSALASLYYKWRNLVQWRVIGLSESLDSSGEIGEVAWSVYDNDCSDGCHRGDVYGREIASAPFQPLTVPDRLEIIDLVLAKEADLRAAGIMCKVGPGPALDIRIEWIRDAAGLSESALFESTTDDAPYEDIFAWSAHCFARVVTLTLDLPCEDDAVFTCLAKCVNLEQLVVGPSPMLSEELFESLPEALRDVTFVLEGASEVTDPQSAARTLARSPVLQNADFDIKIRMPSSKPVEVNGWSAQEQADFSTAVRFTMPNVTRVWVE